MTCTVNAEGQLTLPAHLVHQLGVQPGQAVEVELTSDHHLTITPAQPASYTQTGSIEDFIGLLAGQSDVVLTIEEMNEAIADGWAGKR